MSGEMKPTPDLLDRYDEAVSNMRNSVDALEMHGVAYALLFLGYSDGAESWWPWDKNDLSTKGFEGDLVRAGALIAAEIDRIHRLFDNKDATPPERSGGTEADYTAVDALRSLACWVGAGGYNSPDPIDARGFENKIRSQVDGLIAIETRRARERALWDAEHGAKLSTPPQPEAGKAVASAADEFEHYIRESIDHAPEPLRRLGEYLGNVLDEDQWKTAERLLLGATTALTHPQAASGVTEWQVRQALHAHQYCDGDITDKMRAALEAAMLAAAPKG